MKPILRWTTMVCAFLLLSLATSQAEDAKGVNVGDSAPTFQGVDDQGKPWKSTDHVGKKTVVVYFYPADFTGGCTKQACAFRDDSEKLAAKGIEVIGVSGDSVETHAKFKKHHKLGFTLLADENGAIAKTFGVPAKVGKAEVTVKVDGESLKLTRGATIQRWTFVIGKNGKVIHRDTAVKAADDSKAVLQAIEKQ